MTAFICFQVKSASGAWVEADPIPGTILGNAYWPRKYFPINIYYTMNLFPFFLYLVNIGDLLEKWTAGRYPATLHR